MDKYKQLLDKLVQESLAKEIMTNMELTSLKLSMQYSCCSNSRQCYIKTVPDRAGSNYGIDDSKMR